MSGAREETKYSAIAAARDRKTRKPIAVKTNVMPRRTLTEPSFVNPQWHV
jgi:hypothetical protein